MLKKMIYANQFYPSDPEVLVNLFESFEESEIKKEYNYLIVPHAGYIYSGNVANYGYSSLNYLPKKILLLAPSHNYPVCGFVQVNRISQFETPLGNIKVGKIDSPNILSDDNIIGIEHSIEVQMPFIKYYFPNSIVYPLIVGEINSEESLKFGKILNDFDLILISSDLSHYYDYETALKIDLNTIKLILNKDSIGFLKYGDACGKYPIYFVLNNLSKGNGELLKYQNSGDITGDYSSVVGYASIGFY